MTAANNDETAGAATAADFAALSDQQFILVHTFRRSGVAVPTTVWFANGEGCLFFQTGPEAGKVKRLRADERVTIAPSTRIGEPLGPALSARGRILGGAEAERAEAALHAKYGEQRQQLMRQMNHTGRTMARAYIAIEPIAAGE
ncbi:MAG TPA: PPOX class F420-dependent oxidoreductase [Thermomicrobiales bacterium]|jgi:PPOX class probable F420-dependent enzyme